MKLRITVIIGFIVAVIACQDALETDLQLPGGDGEFSARAGEVVASEDPKDFTLPFNFHITTIRESRCPTSVTCIRFGEVVVSSELRYPDQSLYDSYDFCLGDCTPAGTGFKVADTLDLMFQDRPYRFILKAVTPYPETPEDESGQTAWFLIHSL